MYLIRLSNLLHNTSKSHFNKQTVIALKELALNSVDTKDDTLYFQKNQYIYNIELYVKRINKSRNLYR